MPIEDRGFGSMPKARQRQIARNGGKAAHAKGTAHEWTSEEARLAGQKGGRASRGGRGKLPVVEEAAKTAAPVVVEEHADDVSRMHDEGNPNA